MTEGTALDFAENKMKEWGVENYLLRYRHLFFNPLEKKTLKSENQLLIFIQPYGQVIITSKSGTYNSRDIGINEMQYIHTGIIQIENMSTRRADMRFIQVIPTDKKS